MRRKICSVKPRETISILSDSSYLTGPHKCCLILKTENCLLTGTPYDRASTGFDGGFEVREAIRDPDRVKTGP